MGGTPKNTVDVLSGNRQGQLPVVFIVLPIDRLVVDLQTPS